jgi:hypothetical protein
MMAALGICLFFSSQMPLITLTAFLFFFLRHCVDLLNLLTVFRKEIDSQGRLIESVLSTALAILVLQQIGSIFYCYYNDFLDQTVACLFIFLATIFYIAVTQNPVNQKIQNITSDRLTNQVASEELQKQLEEWCQEYDHPSLVSGRRRRNEFTIVKKTRDFDNWEKYLEEPTFQEPWFQNLQESLKGRMSPIFGAMQAEKISGNMMRKSSVNRMNQSVRNVQELYYNRREQEA